jgi:hypothetical protein
MSPLRPPFAGECDTVDRPRRAHACAYWNVFAFASGGTLFGWMAVTFIPFKTDNGPVIQRMRRNAMIAGGLLGAGLGVFEAVRRECITRRPRNEEL